MPPISYSESHGAGYDKPLGRPAGGPVSHLSPELAAQLASYQDDHVGQLAGPCRHPMANPSETWGGMCAKHRGTPAERAEERRWQRHAAATMLSQQLGRKDVHGWAAVYAVGEAEQLASHLGKPPLVDRVSYLP